MKIHKKITPLVKSKYAKVDHFLMFTIISHTQANQTGSSNAMELEGAKRCVDYLNRAAVNISVFITDRHTSIAKWMSTEHKHILHLYDLWHVCKSILKKLQQAAKEKGCEIILEWKKSIKKHLYWCALSTKQGFGELIVAKWVSLIRHISGKHDNHPNHLFQKCGHGVQEKKRRLIKLC